MTHEAVKNRSRTARIEERRAQLARHAFAKFSAKGFERTTVREIADSAGVSGGLIFHYFPSKVAILEYLFAGLHDEAEAILRPATFHIRSDPRLSLELAVDALIRWIDKRHRRILFVYRETHSLPPAQMQRLKQRELGLTELLASILSAGADEGIFDNDHLEAKANQIMVLAHMWALRYWAIAKYLDLEGYIRLTTTAALQIAGAPERDALSEAKA